MQTITFLRLKKIIAVGVVVSFLQGIILSPFAHARSAESHHLRSRSSFTDANWVKRVNEEMVQAAENQIEPEIANNKITQFNRKLKAEGLSSSVSFGKRVLPWASGLAVTILSLAHKLPAWAQGTANQIQTQAPAHPNYLSLILSALGGAIGIAIAARYYFKKMKENRPTESLEVGTLKVEEVGVKKASELNVGGRTLAEKSEVYEVPERSGEHRNQYNPALRMRVLEHVVNGGRLWRLTKDRILEYIHQNEVGGPLPFEIEIIEEIRAKIKKVHHFNNAEVSIKLFSGPGFTRYM